jgi:L-asparagine transporter-like permease
MSVKSGPGHVSPVRRRTRERPAFQRDLGVPALSLLTLGGVMGSGLFLASGIVITRSGPSALGAYALGFLAMALEIWALAEMSAADPEPGSFLVYAQRVYGPGLVFVGGWVFWFSSVLTMSSEVTAAAVFTRWWWPGVPLWVWALGYSAGIVAVNFVSVRGFGTIEGIMAGVKVGAVLAFLLFFALWLSGLFGLHPQSWSHLAFSAETFWPPHLAGPLSSLVLVLFAYAGTGVIGLAAGETRKPGRTIPASLWVTLPLVLVMYLGSIFVILAMVPYRRVSVSASPFVQVLHLTHIPALSGVMNVVLLFAVLSTMNAALYSNSRVLYSLGQHGEAPAMVARLNRRGIPGVGILWSAALLLLTIVLAFFLPHKAYSYLVTATGFQAMFIWLLVLLTHLRYRPYLERRGPLPFRVPGYPWTTYVTLGIVAFSMAVAPMAKGERVGLAAAAAFIALMAVVYLLFRRNIGRRPPEADASRS